MEIRFAQENTEVNCSSILDIILQILVCHLNNPKLIPLTALNTQKKIRTVVQFKETLFLNNLTTPDEKLLIGVISFQGV